MEDLPALVRGATRITLLLLCLGCFGWAIWPDYKAIFGGFLLGAAGSLLASWHLAWKTTRLGDVVAAGRKPRSGFGFLARACIALLAVVVSVRYMSFNLVATVIGLFTAPLATLVLSLFARRRS